MHLHSNATTNKKQRERLIASTQSGNSKTCRTLAQELLVSLATVHRWKHRTCPDDKSCRPRQVQFAFDQEEQALILSLRQKGLPLDDLAEAIQQVRPAATRSSIYRVLRRSGKSRLPKNEPQDTGQCGQFKEYGPGFVHIDCFYLPQLEAQNRYCFVAIDRATRLCLLAVYENKDKKAATDFLKKCLAFFPFRLQKVLTDNGREFTLKTFKNRWGSKTKATHDFDLLCQQQGIEHRTTKPYTPKTNGRVERMNGLTKAATTKVHHYETAPQMQEDLHGWFVRYNFCRPHRRVGNRTPYEVALAWYEKDPTLFIKEPAALLVYRNGCSQSTET